MFSFYKPKVYRSPTGCCICKAKSSSSRFTDSGKYEEDCIKCFLLTERRTGEICNACVLIVKRWKKLPPGSDRDWRHVVDARAGPGIKSLTKFRAKNKKNVKNYVDKIEKIVKRKHVYVKKKPDRCREQNPAISDDLMTEGHLAVTGSMGSSRVCSPAGSKDTAVAEKRLNDEPSASDWTDLTYFKNQRAQHDRLVDASGSSTAGSLASTSPAHSSPSVSPAHSSPSASPAHSSESISSVVDPTTTTKPIVKIGEESSDSGYDESSNSGSGETKIVKINQLAISNKIISNRSVSSNGNIVIANQPIHSTMNDVQLTSIAVNETVRIKTAIPIKPVPIKQIDQQMCKPMALAVSPNGNITLTTSNSSSSSSSTSRPIVTGIPSNPLMDFAIYALARQSDAH